jgi:hypothetical protein
LTLSLADKLRIFLTVLRDNVTVFPALNAVACKIITHVTTDQAVEEHGIHSLERPVVRATHEIRHQRVKPILAIGLEGYQRATHEEAMLLGDI